MNATNDSNTHAGYPALRRPLTVTETITLPNRIVVPPMVIWQAGADARVTPAHLAHYRSLLGPGLVVVEATAVSPDGRLAPTQIGIFEDAQVPGLRELATLIKQSGAVAAIQLHHAGIKASTTSNYGLLPLVVSGEQAAGAAGGAAAGGDRSAPYRVMDADDIQRVIDDFVAAAVRAQQAGFDMVEIHGAHGYLGSQFLSTTWNRRTDEWGGELTNRMRFLREVVKAIRRLPTPPLVSVRLGVVENGLPLSEGITVARQLAADGVALLHISNGGSMPQGIVPADWAYSDLMYLAHAVHLALAADSAGAGAQSVAPVPVIGVGGIKTGEQAERVIDAGLCDLVAVGKAILADPAWTAKTLSGRETTVYRCVDCRPRCHHFGEPQRCPARLAAATAAAQAVGSTTAAADAAVADAAAGSLSTGAT